MEVTRNEIRDLVRLNLEIETTAEELQSIGRGVFAGLEALGYPVSAEWHSAERGHEGAVENIVNGLVWLGETVTEGCPEYAPESGRLRPVGPVS